jgi:putative tricarboxylic transport membrane protein
MPDLPTADEAGLKGFEVGASHGLGTPDDIVKKRSKTLQDALGDHDLMKRYNDINTEPVADGEATPEGLQVRLVSEVGRRKSIIEATGQFAD